MPPRRRAQAATPARASSNVSFVDLPQHEPSDEAYVANIQSLRRSWQWAAFSQFFYTFAQLLQMPEVTLSDVEDDLARGTSLYLPRIMTRLLVTMSLDRKLTVSNWQAGFRKQCMKRGGLYNPLGPEPSVPSQNPTPEPEEHKEEEVTVKLNGGLGSRAASPSATEAVEQAQSPKEEDHTSETLERSEEKKDDDRHAEDSVKAEPKELQNDTQTLAPSREWAELDMKEKLEALHMLTEWQFDNPHRLRQQMKDDGDHGLWRIEPIGYDSKTNAYWLIGPDRLWIQRALPKPPRPAKRKRPAPAKKSKPTASTSKAAEVDSEPELETLVPSKRTRTANGRASRSKPKAEESTPSGREFQRQAALLSSPSRATRTNRSARSGTGARAQPSPSKRPVLGTRASARLRGAAQDSDDEWQQVPDDWFEDEKDNSIVVSGRRTRNKGKARAEPKDQDAEDAAEVAGLGSDAVSELTELSDDDDGGGEETSNKKSKAKEDPVVEEETKHVIEYLPVVEVPEDFVEWEAICVTLPEWEAIGERFANATHYLEKALHKVLSQSIIPAVVAELRVSALSVLLVHYMGLNLLQEIERKRKIEEAVVHRKRSSRIANKESEKEQARAEAIRKAEEEEKMSRTRRLEARAKKEEDERERRELAREQRRIEREARELKIANRNAPKEGSSERSSTQTTPAPSTLSAQPSVNSVGVATHPKSSRKPTPNGVRSPDWILDCEVCGKNGINIDDGLPMVSCGSCGRWQHITCHDNVDRQKGFPKRNWTTQKFLCQRCASNYRSSNGRHHHSSSQHPSADGWVQPHSQKAPAPSTHVYTQSTSDTRYSQQPPYDNRGHYSGQHYPAQSSTAALYSRSQPHQVAYPQYHHEQRGYSSHTSHSSSQWQNGYSTVPDAPRYADHGAYNASRASLAYTNPAAIPSQSYGTIREPQSYARVPDVQGYQRVSEAQPYSRPAQFHAPNGQWNHAANGYNGTASQRSASHISAAESLAFMQEATPALQGWQAPSYTHPPPQANGMHHASASSVPLHHPQSSMSVGHGSAYQFPAS
ncbi:hypothetical protein BC629DRAFT_1739948 [Irpex lacteus]|nr:hypothetical protein BC629DRAFT_1739948 [Irpex lacteus]